MNTKLLVGAGLITLTLAGGAVAVIPKEPKIQLVNPQKLEWTRPVTDEEWNEDVKKEYVDIRGTKVLQEMLEGQKSKLQKNQDAFEKYLIMENAGLDPVKVLYTEFYQQLKESYPDMSEAELVAEAQNAATTKYSQALWEIEKNTQSIERIEKELELRKKGFVKIKGESTGFFGAEVPPDRIREPID